MIKIGVIEDQKEDRDRLLSFIKNNDKNQEFLINEFENPLLLIDNYTLDYDILFFDIKMPMIDGMEAAKKIREKDTDVIIVFITSLAQFALAGYDVQAFDFLVKPIEQNEFNLKFHRILKKVTAIGRRDSQGSKSILVSTGKEKRKILIDDISFIESQGHHVYIHLLSETEPTRCYDSLSKFEKNLPNNMFVRCNNCYLVNLRKVKQISGYECIVSIDDNQTCTLQISQPKKKSFQESFVSFLEGK